MANKYGAIQRIYKGIKFDSELEMLRYIHLADAEKKGKISDLRLQVPYQLIPAQYRVDYITNGAGVKKKPVLIERAAIYTADFVYRKGDHDVVEDTKGVRTEAYILRRKLMLQVHGIEIKEVNNPGDAI